MVGSTGINDCNHASKSNTYWLLYSAYIHWLCDRVKMKFLYAAFFCAFAVIVNAFGNYQS